MPTKPLISLLLAGALLPAAVAVPASAQGFKTAKFTATYEGTFRTDWTTPRHTLGGDCFKINWSHGSGSETWGVKSRGAQKVVAAQAGRGVSWRAGTHEITGDTGGTFLGGGLITRTSHIGSGWDAGKCAGATSGVNPPRKTDCGTLLPSYQLHFTTPLKGGLVVMPHPADTARNEKHVYAQCSLIMADELTPGAWPDTPGRVDAKKLFGRAKTLKITGRQTWRQVLNVGRPGETTTTSTLRWVVKLRRVR